MFTNLAIDWGHHIVPFFIPSRTWNPLVKLHCLASWDHDFHRGPGAQCAPLCDPPSCKTSCSGGTWPGEFPWGMMEYGDFRWFPGEFYRGFSWKFMRLTFITRVVWYSDQLKDIFFLRLTSRCQVTKWEGTIGHHSHRWSLQVDQVLWKTGNIFVSQPLFKSHHS